MSSRQHVNICHTSANRPTGFAAPLTSALCVAAASSALLICNSAHRTWTTESRACYGHAPMPGRRHCFAAFSNAIRVLYLRRAAALHCHPCQTDRLLGRPAVTHGPQQGCLDAVATQAQQTAIMITAIWGS